MWRILLIRAVLGDQQACMNLIRDSDFVQQRDYYLGSQAMISQWHDCIRKLQLDPPDKMTYVGGVHYPVLVTTNHMEPAVSFKDPVDCWVGGYDESICCPAGVPGGNPECWDQNFNYETCCRKDGGIYRSDRGHFFVVPAMDMNVGSAIKNFGSFAPQQGYAMQTFCKEGMYVLDVGANIGGFTLGFAERVGRTGRVYAFEPFQKTFQMLTANVALNGLANVHTKHIAIGNVTKNMWLYGPDMSQLNVPSAMQVFDQPDVQDALRQQSITYEAEKEMIEVRTLDSFGFQERDIITFVTNFSCWSV